ncbi:MAG: type VI secretion system ImpA family N-terminal domain-containing protein, partial [bacterium]
MKIVEAITKETPTGTDYKYEDAYIAIESEIDKTMSASSAGEVNWQFVQQSSEEILSEQSKDLKIASYWLYAKWKLEGWRGLEEGIPILTQLLEVYQLTLFPKSDKVKRRILEWLHESLTEALMRDVVNVQGSEVESLLTHLETLEKSLAKAFKEDDFALFSSLIRKLTKYLKEKEQREALDVELTQEKKTEEQKPVEAIVKEVAVEVSSPHYSKLEHLQQIQQGLHGSEIQEELLLFEFTLSLAMQKMLKLLALEQPLIRTLFPTNEALETLKQQKDEQYITAVKSMLMSYPCWLEGYLMLFESLETSKSDEMMLELLKYKFIYFVEQHKTTIKTLSPDNYEIINHDLEAFLALNKEERQSGKSSKQ